MASLRSLLDKPDLSELEIGTAPKLLRREETSFHFMNQMSQREYCDGNGSPCWSCWCACGSMEIITIELWGGGGGGAGGCCCSWGIPGGAGAYAKRILDNTGNSFNGRFCMCVAPASCCSPNSCCGYRGCRTFMNGPGLSTFCAAGGRPGCGLCRFFGCFPNSGCGVLHHPNCDDCAEFRDADFGIPGRYGYLQSDCCSPSNYCYYKAAFPLPGGLVSDFNSYKILRAHCNVNPEREMRRIGGWANDNAISGGDNDGYAVGVGGNTARVCGGGCCCGWGGGPGLIRISWT